MVPSSDYWWTRLLLQRGLAVIYGIAFTAALLQFKPLLGDHGLLPVSNFVRQVPFRVAPSVFYLLHTNLAFTVAAWVGILCAALTVLGVTDGFNVPFSMTIWAIMWVIYLSFVNVGQTFYAFGWESILLEAGFYAIFLGPRSVVPSKMTIWIFRWLLFRVMFGAGLIKLRGDPCWRNLTCLDYHYETQPMPNPLSWYFHWGPEWTHQAGVLINHVSELVVPFGYFFRGRIATVSGLITLIFQSLIMASGNLAFLNALTMVLSFSTLDDRFWRGLLGDLAPETLRVSSGFGWANTGLGMLIAVLSIQPLLNLLSAGQIMNTDYNPLHLVGTYGAFGSVTRTRYEVVVEGTEDPAVTSRTRWREYEFKGKPGDPARRPPQIAPYHLRLDWLMWFAAMSDFGEHPWFVHLVEKLLESDPDILGLLSRNPFPSAPPHFVRAELYEYHFTTPDEKRETGRWWTRQRVGDYFPPVSLNSPEFRRLLQSAGWND